MSVILVLRRFLENCALECKDVDWDFVDDALFTM